MTLGKLSLCLVVCALLCAAVSGRALNSDSNVASEGKTSARAGMHSLLNFRLRLTEEMCKFRCNSNSSDGEACEGVFGGLCLKSSTFTGVNITEISKFGCLGEFSGFNESTVNDESLSFSCDGVFGSSDLSHVPLGDTALIILTHYGCSIDFAFQDFKSDEVVETSSACKGADLVKTASTLHPVETEDSQDNLEHLLDEFAANSDPITFDVSQYSNEDLGVSQPEPPEVTVTCNGEEAGIHDPCNGKLQIDIKGENMTATEECDGKWKAMGKKTFTCAGNWSANSETAFVDAEVESVASCEGRSALGSGFKTHHHHKFFEQGEVCIGMSSSTSKATTTEPAPSMKHDRLDIQLQ